MFPTPASMDCPHPFQTELDALQGNMSAAQEKIKH